DGGCSTPPAGDCPRATASPETNPGAARRCTTATDSSVPRSRPFTLAAGRRRTQARRRLRPGLLANDKGPLLGPDDVDVVEVGRDFEIGKRHGCRYALPRRGRLDDLPRARSTDADR